MHHKVRCDKLTKYLAGITVALGALAFAPCVSALMSATSSATVDEGSVPNFLPSDTDFLGTPAHPTSTVSFIVNTASSSGSNTTAASSVSAPSVPPTAQSQVSPPQYQAPSSASTDLTSSSVPTSSGGSVPDSSVDQSGQSIASSSAANLGIIPEPSTNDNPGNAVAATPQDDTSGAAGAGSGDILTNFVGLLSLAAIVAVAGYALIRIRT